MPERIISAISAPAGTVDVAVTDDLQDGESADVEASIRAIDAVTGESAWYVRRWMVKRSGGIASSHAGLGFALEYTSEQDATWNGPIEIIDIAGQAGLRLSGDGANSTNWVVNARYRKSPA